MPEFVTLTLSAQHRDFRVVRVVKSCETRANAVLAASQELVRMILDENDERAGTLEGIPTLSESDNQGGNPKSSRPA